MNPSESAAAERNSEPANGRAEGSDPPDASFELGLDASESAGGSALHRAALLRVAGRMGRIFRLPAPDAPGLAFVGGTATPEAYGLDPALFAPANVSGRGVSAEAAFAGCVGEAVEHLSRLEWGDEPIERRRSPDGEIADHLPARRLHDGSASAVPVDHCLHRARPGARPPSSAGCAAGAAFDDACLAATLELVERDAAALWWCGARPPRPLAPEATIAGLGPVLGAVRRGARERATTLLDLTTDLDVPVVAALSVGPDGFGLACGLAARPSLEEAARAAFLELCQMELSNRLVLLKLRRDGPRALAPVELRHRRRMEGIAGDSPILAALGPPRPPPRDVPPVEAGGRLGFVVERLARRGVECVAVDLTRPAIGVPAVRVLAPFLQGLPVERRTERLARTLADNAGRSGYIRDIELI